MSTSNLNKIDARMQQKHDIAANWKNSDFVPEAGEYIIYDPDDYTSFPRMKIGDGKLPVNELSFVSEIYMDAEEPQDAEDGAIWFNPNEQDEPSFGAGANWDSNSQQSGYVSNRPLWQEEIVFQWDGVSKDSEKTFETTEGTFTFLQKNEWKGLTVKISELIGIKLNILNNGKNEEYAISSQIRTAYELQKEIATQEKHVVAIAGLLYGLSSQIWIVGLAGANEFIGLVAIILDENENGEIWAFSNQSVYFTSLKFNRVNIDYRYQSYFNSLQNNVHVVQIEGEQDLTIDYSAFKPGDVIFVGVAGGV